MAGYFLKNYYPLIKNVFHFVIIRDVMFDIFKENAYKIFNSYI